MLKNYLKIALRNLWKHKSFSLINVLGLAVGLMCAMLILLLVKDEMSVDRYHKKGNRIAQAYLKSTKDDNSNYQPTVAPIIAKTLKDEYPEVIESARLGRLQEVVLKYNNKMIVESDGAVADPSLLDLFTYDVIRGSKDDLLNDPHSIVLTQSFARKYFGDIDPVGKTITMDNTYNFRVTGVIKDLPQNAFRKFDFIVPFIFLKELGYDIVGEPFYPCNYLTYILLKENANIEELSSKVSRKIFSNGEEISFEIILKPFYQAYSFETGAKLKSYILILIAFFILGIACINFINLSTARSMIRSKEIGVRKVTGATRYEVAKQFLFESMILTVISALIALFFTVFSLNHFNQFTDKNLSINFLDYQFILGFLGLIVLTGLLSGSYPSFYLSGFQPVQIFKNQMGHRSGKSYRQFLIIFQFMLSIFFIICTIIFSKQIEYIQTFNWGVNKNNIVYARIEGDIVNQYQSLKNTLLNNPRIQSVTTASRLPIAITSGSYWFWGINDEVGRRICPIYVGYDFPETFNIEMSQGRFYSQEFSSDTSDAVIVNEAAIRKIGLENPVDKPFYFYDRYFTLLGVVKDYQHNSPLNNNTEPLVFWLKPQGNEYLFVKIDTTHQNPEKVASTFKFIENTCNQFSPNRPIDCRFMSQFSFNKERNLLAINRIVQASSILMIFIACLGLFGLTSFLNEKRTKEIGIRKVLGASMTKILFILSKELCVWILIANIISWPLAFFTMRYVLQNYACRVNITFGIFLSAGMSVLLIAILTVLSQTIKTATENPIKSLKYE